MPREEEHVEYDHKMRISRYYGEFRWVHRMMDQPWQQIFGKAHRRIMHDERAINTIYWIQYNKVYQEYYYHYLQQFKNYQLAHYYAASVAHQEGLRAAYAAWNHILLDKRQAELNKEDSDF